MSKFVADLHLHSSYARATSRNLNFDTLSEWAKFKGIQILSSADFTHPVWWEETKSKLKESKYDGFYHYDNSHFVLGSEISSIYSQGGRVRRTHCLLYFPEMADVDKFNALLGKMANLRADGRPIVGLSAKQLLELALSVNEKVIFIPAHAWTPWFSLYGSNSGFDSIDECFGDLSKYIYAIETGLSSDPAMNWRIKELDNRSIVSFSDAHSAPKMGREATIFEADFSYEGVLEALKTPAGPVSSVSQTPQSVSGLTEIPSSLGPSSLPPADRNPRVAFTVEFFPEEGKYHFTGHRNCNVRHSPIETAKEGIICPQCKKKLTIGVMHRVEQLADKSRSEGFKPEDRPDFKSLVPLLEILAESLKTNTYSERVSNDYKKLIDHFGSELTILLKAPIDELENVGGERTAEGIRKVRTGDIVIEPGFDGVYGVVRIWPTSLSGRVEQKQIRIPVQKQANGQTGLFD